MRLRTPARPADTRGRARPSFPWRLLLVVALAGTLVVAPPDAPDASAAPTVKERRLLRLVNTARARRGIRLLNSHEALRLSAHRHSIRMAKRGYIYHHGCLSCLASGSWTTIGENVAKARTVRRAHRKLMRSPGHRRNILCTCYQKAGMGVAKRGGWFYVTQIFQG